MQDLQSIKSPRKNTASNSQILFLVLNTSSVTLFPITLFLSIVLSKELLNPTDVFVPILLATTFASTLAGLLAVATVQRIKLYNKIVYALPFEQE